MGLPPDPDRAPLFPSIREELQQRRPFRSRREELFIALLRSAAVVRRPVSKVVEEHHVSLAQYNVLRILRGAGAEGLPTLAIRERMIEEAAGITRLIDKLEAAGFVHRDRRHATDRRQVVCRITKEGMALLASMDPVVETATNDVRALLEDERIVMLLALLDEVRAGTHQIVTAPPGTAAGTAGTTP
ncbi:MAG: MarR family transcriptional regulator [Gemmatimonadaceae bacterium]|nr:MarR family transcriptional regulator [Gemmatimonadaceae bacterium]